MHPCDGYRRCTPHHPRGAARGGAWPIVLGAVATRREVVAPLRRQLELDLIGRPAIAHMA